MDNNHIFTEKKHRITSPTLKNHQSIGYICIFLVKHSVRINIVTLALVIKPSLLHNTLKFSIIHSLNACKN